MIVMVRGVLLLWLGAVALCLEPTQQQQEEPDSQVEKISHFLLDLIEEYDEEGKGYVPIRHYPRFLTEVFLKGQAATGERPAPHHAHQLLEAAEDFTNKYNTSEVGIQEFYNDLIKDFSVFLNEREQYEELLDVFFSDRPEADEVDPPEQAEL